MKDARRRLTVEPDGFVNEADGCSRLTDARSRLTVESDGCLKQADGCSSRCLNQVDAIRTSADARNRLMFNKCFSALLYLD
jgi:hypothetical protein